MFKPSTQINPQPWMTAPETAAVMEALGAGGAEPQALFVGGCIRNAILGREVTDIDIATTLVPGEVIEKIRKAGLKAVPTGIQHGTVTAVTGGKAFEITTLRRDVETDGRRAVVSFTKDWAEDAQRRDFTMNTLLADADGNIYDPTGRGLDDLRAGRVAFVGDPAQRIAEDYLRILRFFRFHAAYGSGAPDAAGLDAARMASDKIERLSKERITQEFLKILSFDNAPDALDLMFKNEVMNDLPDRQYDAAVLSDLCVLQKEGGVNVMARLCVLSGTPDNVWKYFIFSNTQKSEYEALLCVSRSLDSISEKSIKSLIYNHGNELASQATMIFMARRGRKDFSTIKKMCDWRAPAFPIGGEDIKKELGLKPGPQVGKILKEVEEWWVDQDFRPDRKECLEKVKGFSRQ